MEYETANSKQQTANSKQQTANRVVLVFSILLTFFVATKAQPPSGTIQIVNCFQKVLIVEDGEYTLLRGDFRLNPIGNFENPRNFKYFKIRTFSGNGSLIPYDYLGLNDESRGFGLERVLTLEWIDGQRVPKWDYLHNFRNSTEMNPNWFYFSEGVSKIEITFYSYLVDDKYTPHNKTIITLVDSEESIFLSNSSNSNCFTFENFQMDYTLNLDGFCGQISSKIKRHPDNITNPNDPLNEQDYQFGSLKNLQNFDDHCDECLYIAAPPPSESPDPVPCGCQNFKIEITYEPCSDMFPCYDKVFEKDIAICCNCDIRSSDPQTQPSKK